MMVNNTEVARRSAPSGNFNASCMLCAIFWQNHFVPAASCVVLKTIFVCHESGRRREGFSQLFSHHRAASSAPFLHTFTDTQAHPPCGFVFHTQRWHDWILRGSMKPLNLYWRAQLNITQMNCLTTIANWTQRPSLQRHRWSWLKYGLWADISFKGDFQEISTVPVCNMWPEWLILLKTSQKYKMSHG